MEDRTATKAATIGNILFRMVICFRIKKIGTMF